MNRKRHSFVHDIKIASPCQADWNKMSGDERTRFCQQCKLNVYNISEMTTQEAEKLIVTSEGRVCVRMFRRQDGTVMTRDCPVGLASIRRRAVAIYSGVAAMLSLAVSWVLIGKAPAPQACNLNRNESLWAQGDVQGKIALPTKAVQPPAGQVLLGAPEAVTVGRLRKD